MASNGEEDDYSDLIGDMSNLRIRFGIWSDSDDESKSEAPEEPKPWSYIRTTETTLVRIFVVKSTKSIVYDRRKRKYMNIWNIEYYQFGSDILMKHSYQTKTVTDTHIVYN